jgi:hypothetical protein
VPQVCHENTLWHEKCATSLNAEQKIFAKMRLNAYVMGVCVKIENFAFFCENSLKFCTFFAKLAFFC